MNLMFNEIWIDAKRTLIIGCECCEVDLCNRYLLSQLIGVLVYLYILLYETLTVHYSLRPGMNIILFALPLCNNSIAAK